MKYKTIQNCGELGMEFLNHNVGSRVSRDLMKKLILGIVQRSVKYYNETEHHIFTYREKQLNSVICPSVADLTNSYIMERPLTRKPHGEDEYSGRIDYWISYGNYSFIIELKHCYFAYKMADDPREDISKKFNEALNQLKNIKKNECIDLIRNNKGLIKIALLAVVFYQSSQGDISSDNLRDRDIKEYFKQLILNTDLNKSNLRSLWLLHKNLVNLVEYANVFEIYPAVAFVGNISETIENDWSDWQKKIKFTPTV